MAEECHIIGVTKGSSSITALISQKKKKKTALTSQKTLQASASHLSSVVAGEASF